MLYLPEHNWHDWIGSLTVMEASEQIEHELARLTAVFVAMTSNANEDLGDIEECSFDMMDRLIGLAMLIGRRQTGSYQEAAEMISRLAKAKVIIHEANNSGPIVIDLFPDNDEAA